MDGNTAPVPRSLDARGLLAAWQLALSAVSCLHDPVAVISHKRRALNHSDAGCVVAGRFWGKKQAINYVDMDVLT